MPEEAAGGPTPAQMEVNTESAGVKKQAVLEQQRVIGEANTNLRGLLVTSIGLSEGGEVLLFNSPGGSRTNPVVFGVHPDLGAFRVGGVAADWCITKIDPSREPRYPVRGETFDQFVKVARTDAFKDSASVPIALETDEDFNEWKSSYTRATERAKQLISEEEEKNGLAEKQVAMQQSAADFLKTSMEPDPAATIEALQ